jgi:hypothetical protein
MPKKGTTIGAENLKSETRSSKSVDWIELKLQTHETFLFTLLVIIMAFIEIRIIQEIHLIHYNFDRLLIVAEGVLKGMPSYKVFQNRLLGSWIVQGISQVTGLSFRTSCTLFIYGLIILRNLLTFILLKDLTQCGKTGLKYTFYFIALFIAFQHYKYIALFDFIEPIIFLFFAYGIFKQKGLLYFLILFCIGLLNRESALFISVWLILDSIHFKKRFPFFKIKKIGLFTAGGVTLIGGIVYTKLIRDLLFKRSIIEAVGDDASHQAFGNHFFLFQNLKEMFIDNLFSTNIVVTLFVLGLTGYLIFILFKTEQQRLLKFSLLLLGMLLLNLTIGLVNETRIYFIMIPLILMLPLAMQNRIRDKETNSNSSRSR